MARTVSANSRSEVTPRCSRLPDLTMFLFPGIAGLALHLRHKLRMHLDQIVEEPFAGIEEKRRRQGIAFVWRQTL